MVVVMMAAFVFKLARHDTACSGQQPTLCSQTSPHNAFKIRCERGVRMGGWVGGWMDRWVGGWTGGWVGGWMDGWMGE